MRQIYVLIVLAFSTVVAVESQTVEVGVDSGSGRTVENKSLRIPKYPRVAREAGFGGSISVPVSIDRDGKVIVVGDPTGPYPVCAGVVDEKISSLRKSVVSAAMSSRFDRLGVDGQAVPFEAFLTYYFIPKPERETGKTTKLGARVVGDKETESRTLSSQHALNSSAQAIPQPVYPAAAKAVKASGSVPVQILIREDGTMFSAEAKGGHPLLRAAAERAACQARFGPTLLSGQPVKVSAVMTYNFVL